MFSLPALKCLRDNFPDVQITSVVRPGLIDLLRATGLVDQIFARKSGLNKSKLDLVKQLRSQAPDLALLFSQSAGCAGLAYASGAPRRIGFENTSLGFLLTEHFPFKHPPSTQNNLGLIQSIGCAVTTDSYSGLIVPTPDQIRSADAILAKYGVGVGEPISVLAPGTSGRRSVKEWTSSGFAAVGKHLVKLGDRVIILGAQQSPEVAQETPEILDISGQTRLGEALAIVARARVLIGVDSGMLHLAAAAGTRVVGLYGPSNLNITGPQGEGHIVISSNTECSPCMQTVCNLERKCMTNLSAESVIDAVDRVLSQQL